VFEHASGRVSGRRTAATHPRRSEGLPSVIRVLVVDDHPSFRGSARALLTAEGFDVVGEAEDGAGALTLAPQLEPDLVLLDIQLPDLDGFAVASRLLARDPLLMIVFISSRDSCDYGNSIKESGARGFVSKADLSREALEEILG
jgi:DNA-binding NarL/FixJ family response regulator